MTYPKNFEGGKGSLQRVIPLGTGSVATQTRTIGVVPKNCVLKNVRLHQQGDIAGTSPTLTMQLYERTAAGATGNALLASAVSLDIANAAAGLAGQAATLTATIANRKLTESRLIEAVFTAGGTVSTGPGDVTVELEFVPRAPGA